MTEAFILSACRTPIGKFRGALSSLSATDLGAFAVKSAVERAGVDPTAVNEVILGQVLTAGVGQAPARQAALKGGLPSTVAALTVNKVCGSGLKAAMLAAQAVRCGDAEIIVAGGMESMSQAGLVLAREAPPLGNRTLIDTLEYDGLTCAHSRRAMGDIAEGLAHAAGISRLDQDRFALESHQRAVRSASEGVFNDEIIPVTVRQKKENLVISQDEGPRGDTTLEKLGTLSTVFRQPGTVTAGNSSMISDGAAAVVIASEKIARQSGARPLARIIAAVTAGGNPEDLFTAPVQAIRDVVSRSNRTLQDVDLFELNEAFAAQMLACMRQLELPADKVNIHGGAIALGHPIGASGARVLVTLLHSLRRQQKRLGVAALCLGGGNAVAMLVEAM